MSNIHSMSIEELGRAASVLARLAQEIASEEPAAAACILDAGSLIQEELLARALGGDGEARAHARRVYRGRGAH